MTLLDASSSDSPEDTLRIAVASLRVVEDVAQNVARMRAMLAQAAQGGAELVCFPEYSLRPLNEIWADPTQAVEAIQAACLEHRIWAIFGGDSGGPDQRRNSLYLVDPDGVIRHRYDKVHLWGLEAEIYQPGAPSQVVNVGPARVALMTCWDMAFPHVAADLTDQGADLIVCASYLVDYEIDSEPLQALPLARAFENRVYFVLCDAVSEKTLSVSMICHPLGVRQKIVRSEGLLIQNLDLAELARLRVYYANPAALEDRP